MAVNSRQRAIQLYMNMINLILDSINKELDMNCPIQNIRYNLSKSTLIGLTCHIDCIKSDFQECPYQSKVNRELKLKAKIAKMTSTEKEYFSRHYKY